MLSVRQADEAARVRRELQIVCAKANAGDRLPSHRDLMRRHHASERMVLRALDGLRRDGLIERRNGVGTFVTGTGRDRPAASVPMCDPGGIIAIARPDRSFFDRCLEVLYRLSTAAGRRVVIHPLDEDQHRFTVPMDARPAGVLLFHQRFAALGARLLAEGHRAVLIGVPDEGRVPQVPCVHGDHVHGGFLATHHLLIRGHRRIAMLSGEGDITHSRRWCGHQRALVEARRRGLAVEASVITQEQLAAWEADPERVVDWWRGEQGATGVACWNDREAARLLAVLTQAHLSVPDDVGLVGFDDLPECRVVHPPLTTIDQRIEQQVGTALELLTATAPPAASHVTVVTPSLIPRRSSEARVHGG
jgi:DNA-binding LacI/PurR family transcriptional regulator